MLEVVGQIINDNACKHTATVYKMQTIAFYAGFGNGWMKRGGRNDGSPEGIGCRANSSATMAKTAILPFMLINFVMNKKYDNINMR